MGDVTDKAVWNGSQDAQCSKFLMIGSIIICSSLLNPKNLLCSITNIQIILPFCVQIQKLIKSQFFLKWIVTTLFLLLLLLWTFELYLILSYRYKYLLISWSYLLILSWRSYLLISWSYLLIYDLIWSLDLIIRWWSKICFFIWTLHYYLHAFNMPLTHVFHWWSTYILHMLRSNMLLPYTWHALNTHFTCVYLEDNTWTLVYNSS